MRGVRRWAGVATFAAVLTSAILFASALSTPQASAFSQWQHNGATGCVCHESGKPTDATCANCHTGFASYPNEKCWSCHYPGQDTSTLSSTSADCSQECHLWDAAKKAYTIPFTHGTNPHLGSDAGCLNCHETSPGIADPGLSPHHSGQATGFSDCAACHTSPQKHVGKVACTKCHASATAFHLYTATSPGFKKCASCHTMRHAGRKVPASKCASCHKGTGGRLPQHSRSVTKQRNCGTCHKARLHASAVSSAVTSCRTCHAGRYHAAQRIPGKSTCKRCHTVALRHDDGFQCSLCHRRAIHNPRPSAVN